MIFVHKLKMRLERKTGVLYEIEIVQFPGLMPEKGPIPALTRPTAQSCGEHAGQGVGEGAEEGACERSANLLARLQPAGPQLRPSSRPVVKPARR